MCECSQSLYNNTPDKLDPLMCMSLNSVATKFQLSLNKPDTVHIHSASWGIN